MLSWSEVLSPPPKGYPMTYKRCWFPAINGAGSGLRGQGKGESGTFSKDTNVASSFGSADADVQSILSTLHDLETASKTATASVGNIESGWRFSGELIT